MSQRKQVEKVILKTELTKVKPCQYRMGAICTKPAGSNGRRVCTCTGRVEKPSIVGWFTSRQG